MGVVWDCRYAGLRRGKHEPEADSLFYDQPSFGRALGYQVGWQSPRIGVEAGRLHVPEGQREREEQDHIDSGLCPIR